MKESEKEPEEYEELTISDAPQELLNKVLKTPRLGRYSDLMIKLDGVAKNKGIVVTGMSDKTLRNRIAQYNFRRKSEGRYFVVRVYKGDLCAIRIS